MENLIEKFWSNMFSEKNTMSPKDLIDLYCFLREKEDAMLKSKQFYKNFEAKRKALIAFKFHVVNFYEETTSDKMASVTLEKWYNRSQKLVAKEVKETTVSVKETRPKPPTKPSNEMSILLMGLKKSEKLLEISKRLNSEGVWKGNFASEASSLSKSEMRDFYYALRMDKDWLELLQKQLYVSIDCEPRIKSLIFSCNNLSSYYEKNFHKKIDEEFDKWKNYALSIFKETFDKLKKQLITAKNIQELLKIQESFNKAWKKLKPFDFSRPWLNLTKTMGISKGVEPEKKMYILQRLEDMEQQECFAINDILDEIQNSRLSIIGIEEKHFKLMEKNLKFLDTRFQRLRKKKEILILPPMVDMKQALLVTIGYNK